MFARKVIARKEGTLIHRRLRPAADNFPMVKISAAANALASPIHPLVVRVDAFGDVVMLTALIDAVA